MQLVKTRSYRCPSCEEIYRLDVATDQRALYPEILCDKCETLAPLYRDPEFNAGDIDDLENDNMQI